MSDLLVDRFRAYSAEHDAALEEVETLIRQRASTGVERYSWIESELGRLTDARAKAKVGGAEILAGIRDAVERKTVIQEDEDAHARRVASMKAEAADLEAKLRASEKEYADREIVTCARCGEVRRKRWTRCFVDGETEVV